MVFLFLPGSVKWKLAVFEYVGMAFICAYLPAITCEGLMLFVGIPGSIPAQSVQLFELQRHICECRN